MNPIRLIGLILVLMAFTFMIFTSPPQDRYGRYTPEAYTRGAMMLIAFVVGAIMVVV